MWARGVGAGRARGWAGGRGGRPGRPGRAGGRRPRWVRGRQDLLGHPGRWRAGHGERWIGRSQRWPGRRRRALDPGCAGVGRGVGVGAVRVLGAHGRPRPAAGVLRGWWWLLGLPVLRPRDGVVRRRRGRDRRPVARRRGAGPGQPRNPFRGWSVLFVPSCTGDVFAGDAVRTYRAGSGTVTVQHRGHVNATAALEWMFERVPDPRRVFVAGCSAGSIGSILHAPRILRQYPEAQLAQLGDSLGFLFSEPTDLRALWGRPGAARLGARGAGDPEGPVHHGAVLPGGRRPLAAGLVRPGQLRRRPRPAAVPRGRRGRRRGVPRALLGSLAAIRAGSPNFRSCLLEGSAHCALPSPDFYTLTSGGVSLRDWVAAQANGEPVPNLPPGG